MGVWQSVFVNLPQTSTYLARGDLSGGIASIRLACEPVCEPS